MEGMGGNTEMGKYYMYGQYGTYVWGPNLSSTPKNQKWGGGGGSTKMEGGGGTQKWAITQDNTVRTLYVCGPKQHIKVSKMEGGGVTRKWRGWHRNG